MRTFSPTLAPPAPATPEPAADTGQTCLRDVLAEDAPRAVLQPLVELTSGEVVGYEALVRGPAGTELERPDALFARARADGLLGELGGTAVLLSAFQTAERFTPTTRARYSHLADRVASSLRWVRASKASRRPASAGRRLPTTMR